MCTYLTKRNSVYYFRRVIPVELRPAFNNKSELMFSLRTKEREEAKRLIPGCAVESDNRFGLAKAELESRTNNAGSRRSPRSGLNEQLAFDTSLELDAILEQEDYESEEKHDARKSIRESLAERMLLSTKELTLEEAAFKDLLQDREFELTLAREQLMALKADAPRIKDDNRASQPNSSTDHRDHRIVMLDTDILPRWSAERNVTARTRDTHEAVARWFYERVGRLSVEEITKTHVLEFKDKLLEEGQSAANVNTKLSRMRTLLGWAFENDYTHDNAAQGVKVKVPTSQKNDRRPFDLSALHSLFSSPVYAENYRPTQGRGEAAYWMPLLGLYTGARLEELAQLRLIDLQEISYPDGSDNIRKAWFMNITADDEEGLALKNAESERRVPVHSDLIELGFVRYAQKLSGGNGRLFPQLKPNGYGKYGAKWGEWFSKYRRETCGITDRRIVFHSFRHSFKDLCRNVGIDDGVARQLMGHSPGDTANQYGSGFSDYQLVAGMKKFRVPGLTLPPPPNP